LEQILERGFCVVKESTSCIRGAQRFALPAGGGRVDPPSKRDSAAAREMPKKRGAYPKSGARIVRRCCME
jgi:hypothetical protein